MAAPIIQVLDDSEKNYVIHVIGIADTVGGTIVDISATSANTRYGVATKLRLDRIQYETDATIKFDWDATANVTFFVAPPGQDDKDYRGVGGINNNAGVGVTGDVKIPLPAGASNYTATLWFRKKF